MKIVFMGTPRFAIPSLHTLLKNNYDIAYVVTAPDKRKGRGMILTYPDVKKFALENNIPVLQPENLKDKKFIDTLSSLKPDLIIVVAFRVLPKEILSIARLGIFNLHASLLPKLRGAAPINWAIINGENDTGVTTFFIKEKIDSGNIILQRKIPIAEDDNAGTLHDKLSELGASAVADTVKIIEQGNIHLTEQDESLVTPAPKIFKEDCLINWNQNAVSIHNFIRGLSPYPGAFTFLENKSVKIFKTGVTEIPFAEPPAQITVQDNKIFVTTKDNLLEILELQLEGKKRVSAVDFINGMNAGRELKFQNK